VLTVESDADVGGWTRPQRVNHREDPLGLEVLVSVAKKAALIFPGLPEKATSSIPTTAGDSDREQGAGGEAAGA
jgi:hypothetical protein